MDEQENRRVFTAMVLESPDREGFWPLLRFSAPFADLEAHKALEYLDHAINTADLSDPDSALILRRLHLARSVVRQCITHHFMVEGEPPPEPEPEIQMVAVGEGTAKIEADMPLEGDESGEDISAHTDNGRDTERETTGISGDEDPESGANEESTTDRAELLADLPGNV